MARPTVPPRTAPATPTAGAVQAGLSMGDMQMQVVSGNAPATMSASASVFRRGTKVKPQDDRREIAKRWQIEAYRHVNICGEARYASTLFANMAARAEIGISEGSTLGRKPVWVNSGVEVDTLAEIAPTVRERAKLIRDYMTHYVIAGECYLIARNKTETDPGFENDPKAPIWEIVAVTELRRTGSDAAGNALWQVRHDNGNYIDLSPTDPVIRMWNPDPEDRREAWSPFRSLLPTLREIEWLTQHIFTQVRSRLMSAGVWFLPNNLTYPAPPPDAVEGGIEALAEMNEAEQFMLSIAASSMEMLDSEDVSLPSIVMADPAALEQIDQKKLIQFWSEIDDKAMVLRSDAVRRFALGMDLPPEQVLGSSGLAVTGAGGSAGSVNHWGVWANEEQTISAHIEPALDNFVGVLTVAVIRVVTETTDKVVAYDTATLRLRQDRSKEAMEWYDRGVMKAEVALRETGFDPENDMMDAEEFKRWLLVKIAGGSATPEQVQESLRLLGVVLNTAVSGNEGGSGDSEPATRQPGRNAPPSLEEHPYEGPPREQHDHSPAPYAAKFGPLHASAEVLVLRALEKAGNRLLNDGKRGRDRDRSTPPHLAHLTASSLEARQGVDFDFTLLPTVLGDRSAADQAKIGGSLVRFCRDLYRSGEPYTREALIEALEAV